MMIKNFIDSFKDRIFLRSVAYAFVFLFISLIINFYAGKSATSDASNHVSDIFLSNVPVFDVDGTFVYGAYALIGCIFLVAFAYSRRIPFIVKSIALFYVIRSMFVILTHIAPYPSHVIIDPLSFFSRFFDFSGALFFSGHVGLPFLIALVFWDNKVLRTSFISLAIILGAVSLMGHLHYSIDVLAAFFITYSIYHLAERFFKKDKEMY